MLKMGMQISIACKKCQQHLKQICEKIYNISIVGKSDLLFSVDMYKENSIKSLKRTSGDDGKKRIIKGISAKRPENWK